AKSAHGSPLRSGDHLQGLDPLRRNRPQDVRDVGPDAPLSPRRTARPPARADPPLSARADSRRDPGDQGGRSGQSDSGDRPMSRSLDSSPIDRRLVTELEEFRRTGVYKRLNYLESPQGPVVRMEGRGEVIILSSNNYLGLSAQREVVAAGKAALDRFGAGTASVRFICGTYTIHRA